MNRAQHPSNNSVLGAPHGMSIEQCNALPITRVQHADGTPAVVSFWRPTPEQLRLLAEGRLVRLCALGMTHAPVMLGVDGDGEMDL